MDDNFSKYLELLLEANSVMNLTAIREPEEIRVRHFEDSIKLLDCADFKDKRVLDVGSGAGFPGLPLKLAEPSMELTLLDGTGKKVEFLQRVSRELGLDGVTCTHGRAEALARTEARESFDIVTARGVAALPVLCEICLPLVKPGGFMLAMKGTPLERADYAAFGGRRLEDYRYELSDGTIHSVIIVEKVTKSDMRYPRPWAQLKKRPLA